MSKSIFTLLSCGLLAVVLVTAAGSSHHERARTRFVIQVGNEYGYIDRSGRVVIPPKYDLAWNFTEGLASVSLSSRPGHIDKAGFIDEMGKLVIPMRFQYARAFAEGRAEIEVGDKWGFIDKRGCFVVKPRYDQVHSFSEGLAAVELNGKWGFVDKDGKIVIPPRFIAASGFSNGLAEVWDPGCTYIDTSGNTIWTANHEPGANGG